MTRLGHSLVSPWLYLRLTAKTISIRPAENKINHATYYLVFIYSFEK
ncbi:hypothetical protein CRENPOLYSF2_2530005 [Crenothrix polyspora]|uniref:Uncharacterized protein n=1 Tax=Crenothrix polyspora TaxID=360316 RepID=A0A1R4H706_9GAMM|nr:hypothetical protein CRENPOLYSF2_2530005 [Crenothrix polyspora]